MTLIWPNGSATIPRVTSEFNPNRKHPVSSAMRPHRGIDLAGWSEIVSPVAGVVTTNSFQAGGAGNYVNITADNGDVFKFFHLKSRSSLKVGQRVSPGTVIGVMGATGGVTGVHLHFEVWSGGKAVNPRTYYAQHQSGVGAEFEGDPQMEERIKAFIATVHDTVYAVKADVATVHATLLGVKADVATVHNTVIAQGKELAAVKAELAKVRPDIATVHNSVLRAEKAGKK